MTLQKVAHANLAFVGGNRRCVHRSDALTDAMGFFVLLLVTSQVSETADLDLKRYLGTWYEQARYDLFFERGCVGSTATYSLKEDSTDLKVVNRCFKEKLDGDRSTVEGKAWVVDPKEPGKLKVQFFWPFSADYWVLEVAPDYSWALIGNKKKSSCWIMTRAETISPDLYDRLVAKVVARGYDEKKLIRVLQRSPIDAGAQGTTAQ